MLLIDTRLSKSSGRNTQNYKIGMGMIHFIKKTYFGARLAIFFLVCFLSISGPKRFEFDDDRECWVNTRDGDTELRSLLTAEIKEECGVDLGNL